MTRKIRIAFGKALYVMLFQWLPTSYALINVGQKRLRVLCGHLILKKCGKGVNIERRAVFSSGVELGDNSGIGVSASISGKCVIGNDVLMGPHCTIYSWNHRFDDMTRTIREQGFQMEKPVIIGDDVWIYYPTGGTCGKS